MSRFFGKHTFEGALVYDVVSRVDKAIVAKLIIHAAENVYVLFVQTLVVLQTIPFLVS